jgi:actin-like ATPase involved in cell morphogenesis
MAIRRRMVAEQRQESRVSYQVGIDLGTTFTAAAVHRDGRSNIFSLGSQTAAMPSVVLLREDETELTGEAAVRRALNEPERVAREFKRRLGDTTPIIVGGAPYSAEQLMARLLTKTLGDIAQREGGAPDRIAITHPANWGPYKIDLLQQAVRIAGIPSDRVDYLTEPEAAAVSYATQERVEPGEIVAVYDLGGGTFDAAVLRRTESGFEIIGRPEGIERMGGIDFDAAVFAHVNRALDGKLQELDPEDPMVMSGVARLRDECVEAKIALSSDTDATIPVLLPNLTTEVRITRSEFEALIRPSLADSIAAMHRAIESADITAADVSKVLLVGGSSRIPLISQMVSSELGRPVAVDADPKHAVALGAAAFASGAASGAASAPTSGSGDALTAASAAAAAPLIVPADEVAGAGAPTLPPTEQQPVHTEPTQPMPAQPAPTPPVPNEAAAAAAMPTAPAAPPMAPSAPPPGGAPAAAQAGGSGSSKLPLVIGAIVAVLVIGIGAFVVLGGGGDSDDDATDTTVANTVAPDTTVAPVEESVPDTTLAPVEESVPDTTVPPEELVVIDDETLTANVAAAVVAVSPDVQSSVTNSVATLIGQTDEASAAAAVSAAAGVDGIVDVVDQITVLLPDELCTDEMQSFNRWACINSVTYDGTELRASFSFGNAGEELSTAANHLHFFSDEYEPVQAGTPNGPGALSTAGGVWEVWDDPTGFFVDPIAVFGSVPTRLCVEVANANHALENLESGNCWPVEIIEQPQGLVAPQSLVAPQARVDMAVRSRSFCDLDGIQADTASV